MNGQPLYLVLRYRRPRQESLGTLTLQNHPFYGLASIQETPALFMGESALALFVGEYAVAVDCLALFVGESAVTMDCLALFVGECAVTKPCPALPVGECAVTWACPAVLASKPALIKADYP